MANPARYQHPSRRAGAVAAPFFDLTKPEHAYLFGLLQTDGHHTAGTRNRGRISIELKADDAAILHKLVGLVPWYSAVRYRTRDTNVGTGHRTATWTLSSWDARAELEALGLPSGPKSRSVAPPGLPYARRDDVRGLIDGDGSVGFTAAGLPFMSFVTASEHLARYSEAYAEELTGIARHTNPTARDRAFNPMHQTDAAATIAAHLYQPGDLAIERKAVTAAQVGQRVRPAGMRRAYKIKRWTKEEDEAVLADRALADIAAELGRTYQSVSMRRTRLRSSMRS